MRSARDTAEVASFLICLCVGLTISFEWMLPALRDVSMDLMKHLFGVGVGFGIGVSLFLIYLPIQDLFITGLGKLSAWINARDEAAKKSKKGGGDES